MYARLHEAPWFSPGSLFSVALVICPVSLPTLGFLSLILFLSAVFCPNMCVQKAMLPRWWCPPFAPRQTLCVLSVTLELSVICILLIH